MGDYGLI